MRKVPASSNEGKNLTDSGKLGRTGPVLRTYVLVVGPRRIAYETGYHEGSSSACLRLEAVFLTGSIPAKEQRFVTIGT
jgi:hypothetical protein